MVSIRQMDGYMSLVRWSTGQSEERLAEGFNQVQTSRAQRCSGGGQDQVIAEVTFPRTLVGSENGNWTGIDLMTRRELAISCHHHRVKQPLKRFILGLVFRDAYLWEWGSTRMKGRIVIDWPWGASWRWTSTVGVPQSVLNLPIWVAHLIK